MYIYLNVSTTDPKNGASIAARSVMMIVFVSAAYAAYIIAVIVVLSASGENNSS